MQRICVDAVGYFILPILHLDELNLFSSTAIVPSLHIKQLYRFGGISEDFVVGSCTYKCLKINIAC
jgi:hypothetical protein